MRNKYKLMKTLDIISDVLFVIVMAILVCYLIYGFSAKSKNQVPSFFGTSYVRVVSNSMKASGFDKGDVAIINKVNITEIKEGDIIAFYRDTLTGDFSSSGEQLEYKTGEKSFEGQMIVFHKVGEVKIDKDGQTWVRTYGTSNVNGDGSIMYDTYLTRGDHIVGVYTESALADVLQFVSSSTGLIVVVIVPSAILLMVLAFSIVDTIDKIIRLKKQQELAAALALTGANGDVNGEQNEENNENSQLDSTKTSENKEGAKEESKDKLEEKTSTDKEKGKEKKPKAETKEKVEKEEKSSSKKIDLPKKAEKESKKEENTKQKIALPKKTDKKEEPAKEKITLPKKSEKTKDKKEDK